MKNIIFIFFCILICCNNCFARIDCPTSYKDAYYDYWETNKDKQINGDDFNRLDDQGKREAKIRNLCFAAALSWHGFCAFKNCNTCEDGKTCTPVSEDDKVFGHSLQDMCNYSKIDCFTEDIDTIFAVLQETGDDTFKMFVSDVDINNVTRDILNGETINTSIIDIDKSVCYKTDKNGDTVWHAFARSNRDMWGFANLCVSLNENPLDMLTRALYKTRNNKGKTAVQEAINSTNPDNLFGFLSAYAKQEKKDYCKSMPQEISTTNNIDLKKIKSLLKC